MYKPGEKFHGMTIITDYDCIAAKGKAVLEMNSNGECVLREYDKKMEVISCATVNLYEGWKNGKMSESNCTGGIKRQLRKGSSMLISMSAVEKIMAVSD